MMLTIHGLPLSAKYRDVKMLIKEKCNISDYILDNLVSEEDGTKKVRVGLADEREGTYFMKCFNGFNMSGHILRVVPVGKAPQHNPPNFEQHGNFPPRNDYQNQPGSNFGNRQMGNMGRNEPMAQEPVRPSPVRVDPWSHGSGGNQWGGSLGSQPGPNQSINQSMQQGYNYQQSQGMPSSFGQGQQSGGSIQRGDARQFDQRDQYQGQSRMQPPEQGYGYPSKNNMIDPARGDSRAHVLRSVEIIDEPLARSLAQPNRYPQPGQNYDAHQKPITIMKDNFQGPQYNLDRSGQPTYQAPGGHSMNQATRQLSPWNQPVQQDKQLIPQGFQKSYPDGDRRQVPGKNVQEPQRNVNEYNKPGPRFSPRRDVPGGPMGRRESPGRRMTSPGRGIPLTGQRMPSPGRRMPPTGQRMPSPGRRMPSPGRRMPSPGRRMPSPGRRMPSPGRRMPSPGRRMPSPGRRMPSPGRRMPSPGRRMPSPGRRMPPSGQRVPSPGRRMPSPGRRMPSPGRRMPSPGRRMPSPGRRMPPTEQRMPSPGRRMPSPGRRMPSPGRRMPSPGRRMPSPGRRMPSPGRRMPPTEQRMPSPGRRMPSPGRRMPSPGRRMPSPGRRMPSPGRRMPSPGRRIPSPAGMKRHGSPGGGRYSPTRRHIEKPMDKFGGMDSRAVKEVRPAYDAPAQQAPNQAIYSGGYRPSLHENVQYPIPGLRQAEARAAAWDDKDKATFRGAPKKDDDKREGRGKFEGRAEEARSSRSPPRDRRPRHSPSPRSPRRSWALEKRRSPAPAPPPPPLWPPHSPPRHDRFAARKPDFEPRDARFESRDPKFEPRDPKFEPREPKFEPRDVKFDSRGPKFEPREEYRRDDAPKRFDREFREPHESGDGRRREEFARDDYSRREEPRGVPKPGSFDKELDDVYKRAVEFSKRAEELRKREERRRDDGDDRAAEYPKYERREEQRPGDWSARRPLDPALKAKREKAVDELASKILQKCGAHFSGTVKDRIYDELKLSVGKIMQNMFGNEDVSFIEMVVKFQARITDKEERKIFDEVLSVLPSYCRAAKRPANESRSSEVPSKSAKRSTEPTISRDSTPEAVAQHIPEWKANPEPEVRTPPAPPSRFDVMPQMMMQQQMMLASGFVMPMPNMPNIPMANIPNMPNMPLANIPNMPNLPNISNLPNMPMPMEMATPEIQPSFQPSIEPEKETYHLYLCKDDFDPYTDNQAEYLKKFLITQLVNASSEGWSPDFTVKGLQNVFRYELVTVDDATRDWLMNMDFSEFSLFNVLVYTKEELWYERAAVWLPGHSRCRNIEPLTKLKLQNNKLDGVNISKWKFVKKVVTAKGTRIYVDMPPSSARALEKQKMLLSYELQKVSVFLKAVAVDKEAFDSGLRETSVKDSSEIIAAIKNAPMPSLGNEPDIVKICLKGNKALSVQQAKKVKEMIIYHIFKYHQGYPNGGRRTDFIKYGFCLPGYFGIVPENSETRRWLLSLNIGKLKRHAIVVLGTDDTSSKYIPMSVHLRREPSVSVAEITQRLKQSNRGVKGLNFQRWKSATIDQMRNKTVYQVDMDLESVETLIKMKCKLDCLYDMYGKPETAYVKLRSGGRLEDVVRKMKEELSDSYDVTNMDLASSDDDNDMDLDDGYD